MSAVAGVAGIPEVHADSDHGDHGAHVTATGVSNEKVGMWAFLGSECLLFGALIATFLVYSGRSINGPYLHKTIENGKEVEGLIDIPFTSASSFVLLMSSLTMVLAHSSIKRNDIRRFRLWIGATALLGSIFIGGQVYEFSNFLSEGLGMSTNLFGSSFYVLTGFHGVHVTLGILMLLSLLNLSRKGTINQKKHEAVEIVGLYWHFVDVVWIVIFTVVYLIP
jgi:heme/copper-type cytochrome/quinol oxidase subunit 3